MFQDRAAGDAYLHGPLFASLKASPSFRGFDIRRFEVVDDLTCRTWGAWPVAS